jgi:hypothetical protein
VQDCARCEPNEVSGVGWVEERSGERGRNITRPNVNELYAGKEEGVGAAALRALRAQ